MHPRGPRTDASIKKNFNQRLSTLEKKGWEMVKYCFAEVTILVKERNANEILVVFQSTPGFPDATKQPRRLLKTPDDFISKNEYIQTKKRPSLPSVTSSPSSKITKSPVRASTSNAVESPPLFVDQDEPEAISLQTASPTFSLPVRTQSPATQPDLTWSPHGRVGEINNPEVSLVTTFEDNNDRDDTSLFFNFSPDSTTSRAIGLGVDEPAADSQPTMTPRKTLIIQEPSLPFKNPSHGRYLRSSRSPILQVPLSRPRLLSNRARDSNKVLKPTLLGKRSGTPCISKYLKNRPKLLGNNSG